MRVVIRVDNGLNVITGKIRVKLAETFDNIAGMLLILGENDTFTQLLATFNMNAFFHESD